MYVPNQFRYYVMQIRSSHIHMHTQRKGEKQKGKSVRGVPNFNITCIKQTGTKVKFLVWPALFLHKGGALISKGVLQPIPDTN
jgi:hypothetical protein